jgi:hypothetical protein
MSRSKPTYHLRVRRYLEGKFVSIWLVRADGPAEACLLWGEVLPRAVAEIAEATGLPVREETSPLSGMLPLQPPGTVSIPAQRGLFGDAL